MGQPRVVRGGRRMLIIIIMIIVFIVGIILMCFIEENLAVGIIGIIMTLFSIGIFINGCINGFINYPKTEGTHVGMISAVDLEGIYFRRYEVYLKTSDYTTQTDETIYRIYEYEKELLEKINTMVGKQVKITYGHDGGYIGWNSCGTYHIKNIELIEEE